MTNGVRQRNPEPYLRLARAGFPSRDRQEVGLWLLRQRLLQQAEINFDRGADVHRRAALHAGLELPLLNRLDRLLVQTHAEALDDVNIARVTLHIHDHRQHHRTAVLGLARFFRVLRIHFEYHGRLTYSAANAEHAAADAASRSGAETAAVARSQAAAAAAAHAAAEAGAVREIRKFGQGVAPIRQIILRQNSVRGRNDRRRHFQLRFLLHDHRRRELLQGRFGSLPLGNRRNLPCAAASTAARLLRGRLVGLNVRVDQVQFFRNLLLHYFAGKSDHQQRKNSTENRDRRIERFGVQLIQPPNTLYGDRLRSDLQRRQFNRPDQVVKVLVKGDKPRNLSLIRRK